MSSKNKAKKEIMWVHERLFLNSRMEKKTGGSGYSNILESNNFCVSPGSKKKIFRIVSRIE